MDDKRVAEYIHNQGGELIESKWSPFGKGWGTERNDRIYQVRFRDQLGNIRKATVKTSRGAGVYFTDDHIIERAKNILSVDAELEEENARLRKQIEDMRKQMLAESKLEESREQP